jgi:hypothetical protein
MQAKFAQDVTSKLIAIGDIMSKSNDMVNRKYRVCNFC